MANPIYPIPRPGSPISETGSVATREWYNYWQNLSSDSGGPSTAELENDITIISEKLGSPDGTPENIPPQSDGGKVIGVNSIASIGALPGVVTLTLQGDSAAPGNTYYYGTNGTGAKGFYTVSSTILGTAGDIVLTTASNGVTTIDLAPVTNAGAGVLEGITVDGFGRVTGSHPVTIAGTSANQITVTGGNGSGSTISLALPQDIGTGSSPSFAVVNLAADPSTSLQAATKQYVDNALIGLSWKLPALCVATANIVLSGLQTIDGYTTLAGDRVLVTGQTLAATNGIYIASASAWTRSTDMTSWAQVPNASLFVEQGTTNADTAWTCTSNPGGTIGVTAINFVKFNGSTAGVTSFNGRTGTVAPTSGDYTFSLIGGMIAYTQMPASGVAAGTYGDATHIPSVTVNAEGIVTGVSLVSTGASSVTAVASETITAPAMVSFWLNGSTWSMKNASANDATRPAHGFVNTSVASGSVGTVYLPGQVMSGVSGLSGPDVYLATTAVGAPTSTPPTMIGSGNLLQRVGTAILATSFIFNPDTTGIVL